MNINNVKTIFSSITTFSSSTITTFLSGKDYEFPSDGVDVYPLIYLEEDYLITTINNNGQPNQENWSFSIFVLDQIDSGVSKDLKDSLRDDLLTESRKIIKYLREQLKQYQGNVLETSFLSMLDMESDNTCGWKIDIILSSVSQETKCSAYE